MKKNEWKETTFILMSRCIYVPLLQERKRCNIRISSIVNAEVPLNKDHSFYPAIVLHCQIHPIYTFTSPMLYVAHSSVAWYQLTLQWQHFFVVVKHFGITHTPSFFMFHLYVTHLRYNLVPMEQAIFKSCKTL